LRDAGQMMVVSAGNSGPACNTVDSPALADSVLSVGAYQQGGQATSFSSRGPVRVDGSGRIKPDISAPGLGILSSVPDGGYGTSAGTSMAGPHVTGLVALLWSANPDLIGNIDATEQIIFATADEQAASDQCGPGSADPNDVYGYGLLDADQAVEQALGSN
jgi:subtilisin family serine protease